MDHFPPLEMSISTTRGDAHRGSLVLRPWSEDDIPTIARACADRLTQLWLPLPNPYTREDAAMFVAGSELGRRSGDGVECAIARADTGAVVGCVGAKHSDWDARVTEVGYWAVPEHRGHGYVTAATRALSAWVLLQGMDRVELHAAPENVASNRVAVGAGFAFEALKPGAGLIHAGRVDLNLYARARSALPS